MDFLKEITTGRFNKEINFDEQTVERGLIIYKRNPKDRIFINKVMIHPYYVGENKKILRVYNDDTESGLLSVYEIDLIPNVINTFDLHIEIKGMGAKILLDGKNVGVNSAVIEQCMDSKNKYTNDYFYCEGFYGEQTIRGKESFGIVANIGIL